MTVRAVPASCSRRVEREHGHEPCPDALASQPWLRLSTARAAGGPVVAQRAAGCPHACPHA
eukprot:scaffold2063_cov114-Isochrysis_galbana.AAC.5